MKQIDFIWKMKGLGLNVLQTTDTVVQATLAPEVILEHSTHVNHEQITLVIGEIGSDDEVDYMIDDNPTLLEKVIKLHESNASKEDYITAFRR